MKQFIERHSNKIAFTLECYGRVVLSGSLVDVGYAQAMTTAFLRRQGVRVFNGLPPPPLLFDTS